MNPISSQPSLDPELSYFTLSRRVRRPQSSSNETHQEYLKLMANKSLLVFFDEEPVR